MSGEALNMNKTFWMIFFSSPDRSEVEPSTVTAHNLQTKVQRELEELHSLEPWSIDSNLKPTAQAHQAQASSSPTSLTSHPAMNNNNNNSSQRPYPHWDGHIEATTPLQSFPQEEKLRKKKS